MKPYLLIAALVHAPVAGCAPQPDAGNAASAQAPQGAPIQIITSIPDTPPPAFPGVVQQELAQLTSRPAGDPAARLSRDVFKTGARVRFELFGDYLDAVVTSVSVRDASDMSFVASREREAGTVFVTFGGGQFSANIHRPGKGDIAIAQFDADRLLVTRYAPEQDVQCSILGGGVTPKQEPRPAAGETSRIDVGVLYTPEAACEGPPADNCEIAEQNVRNAIVNWIDHADTIFAASGTGTTLNLVAREKLDYEESGAPLGDLRALNRLSIHPGATALGFRERHRADVVVLLVSKTSRLYGVANLFDVRDPLAFAPCATAVVVLKHASRSRTLVHEIGHTMGAGHEAGEGEGRFCYSHGNLVSLGSGNWSTIMATGNAQRMDRFSGPDVPVPGSVIVTGTPLADNVRTVRATRQAVESFQPAAFPPNPRACQSLVLLPGPPPS